MGRGQRAHVQHVHRMDAAGLGPLRRLAAAPSRHELQDQVPPVAQTALAVALRQYQWRAAARDATPSGRPIRPHSHSWSETTGTGELTAWSRSFPEKPI